MGEGKLPKAHRIPKVVLGLLKIPTKLATRKLVIPIILQFTRMLPPLIQTSKLHYTKVHPPSPNYKNTSPIYPNNPPPYQIPSPYQGVAPTMLMCSRATEHPLLFIKSKLHYTKILLWITQLYRQTTKQIHIREAKLLVQIPKVINMCLLLNKAAMTLPDPDLRRRLQGTSLCLLKAEQSCTSDWLRTDTSTLWVPNPWMSIQNSTDPIRDVIIIPTVLGMILKIVSI